MAHAPGAADGLCPACSTGDRLRELARVRYHLARARALGLPATLTLGQWLATLEHFGWRCAYCQAHPYSDLDHFIPLAAGGGTTAGNCVPACAGCNGAKRAIHPYEQPLALPRRSAVERVAAYLQRQA